MNQNPFQTNTSKPAPKRQRPQNFVEALKGIGGGPSDKDQARPIKPHVESQLSEQQPSASNQENLFLESKEALKERHLARHREVIATPIYDRREKEIKAQIEAIRKELRALAKEIATLGLSIQKAVEEEIAHPGSYHLSFFEKLRSYLIILRKKVSESKNWLALSQQRKHAKNYYWGNVKKSGTKFMLSSERTLATQTG